MIALYPLSDLYFLGLADVYKTTPLEDLFGAYCNNECLEEYVRAALEDNGTCTTPWDVVAHWRDTLAIAIILQEKGLISDFETELNARIKLLLSIGLWPSFQLITAYQSVVLAILRGHPAKFANEQLPSGAVPLETGGHWNWAKVPYPCYNAELGILWSFYAFLRQDEEYFKAAKLMAEWQKNTLDYNGNPFIGLFAHEGDATLDYLLTVNYLLFDSVANGEMPSLAHNQLKQLQSVSGTHSSRIHPLYVLLEKWLATLSKTNHIPVDIHQNPHLSLSLVDSNLALVGYRSPKCSAVATLLGGGSGLGCYYKGDVQVVSFGPQIGQLGDCSAFGIEGGAELLKHLKVLDANKEGFTLEGMTRLRSTPTMTTSLAAYREGVHSGIWLNTKICLKNDSLFIDLSFTGTLNNKHGNEIAVVFFIKALSCLIDGKQVIQPRSLQHYWGGVHKVDLQGMNEVVSIETGHQGEMHVIPLAGGSNFWGADYLVAYMFSKDSVEAANNHTWIKLR